MPTSSQLFLHTFRNSWKWVLTLMIVPPIMVWLFLIPFDARFSTFPAFSQALGQATGIIGTLLFSFSLILSFRNKYTEIIFGGLDKLYKIHHRFGMYGLFLLLLHPLLLSIPIVAYSIEEAALFFTPFQTSDAVDFGILSILLFMVLIGVTLFGVIFSYPALKKFHMFLGVAFLFGALHGFLIPSDIQNNIFIRVWVLGFVVIGLGCYVTYSLLKKITVPKKRYSVVSLTKKEGGITEIYLKPKENSINHLPGQFGFFYFVTSKIVSSEPHPFTISSWKGNGDIVISVKALGDFTTMLSSLEKDSLVDIEGPYGEFSYGYGKEKQIWVAGGVGVTPFVSFTEHAITTSSFPFDIDFFYSVRTKEDLAYHELFTKASQLFPSYKYHPMPSDTDGYITGEVIAGKISDVQERDIFVCGPPPMMKALISSFVSLGIKKTRIHSELFSLLK